MSGWLPGARRVTDKQLVGIRNLLERGTRPLIPLAAHQHENQASITELTNRRKRGDNGHTRRKVGPQ